MSKILLEERYKSILVVTPEKINLDIALASYVFSNLLLRLGKQVELFTHKEEFISKYTKFFQNNKINLLDKIKSNRYMAKIRKERGVEDIEIKKNENEIQIILDTDIEIFENSNLEFRPLKLKYDLIILLGFEKMEDNKLFIENYKSKIAETKLMLVNYKETSIPTDFRFVAPSSSFSELIKIWSRRTHQVLEREEPSILLAGIFDKTNNLRNDANEQTIENIYYLVSKDNAIITTANKIVKIANNIENVSSDRIRKPKHASEIIGENELEEETKNFKSREGEGKAKVKITNQKNSKRELKKHEKPQSNNLKTEKVDSSQFFTPDSNGNDSYDPLPEAEYYVEE